MKRRTMLATLFASVSAGCVSRAATDSGTTSSTTAQKDASTTRGASTTRTTSKEYLTMRVRSGPPASEGPVALTGTVRRGFSSAHPAIVRLALSNRTDTEQRVNYRPRLPLSPGSVQRRGGEEVIHLLPADGEQIAEQWSSGGIIPDTPTNACWELPGDYTVRTKGASSLAPGETVEREYVVLDGRTGVTCLVAGTYAVRSRNEQHRPEHELGFAVVLGGGEADSVKSEATLTGGDTTARTDTGDADETDQTDGTNEADTTETTDRNASVTGGGNGKAKQHEYRE